MTSYVYIFCAASLASALTFVACHGSGATAKPTPTGPAAAGQNTARAMCTSCHSLGADRDIGPGLLGVTTRRTDEWLGRWLADPEAMIASDETAKKLYREYDSMPMPNFHLTKQQISELIAYFHWADGTTASP